MNGSSCHEQDQKDPILTIMTKKAKENKRSTLTFQKGALKWTKGSSHLKLTEDNHETSTESQFQLHDCFPNKDASVISTSSHHIFVMSCKRCICHVC
eukprot:m.287574 g.287574  ORF g.287574 m.287574 type:complete len:97 (+) comp15790_c5_seq3:3942-4232(+)